MKFPALPQRLVSQRLASSFRHLFFLFLLFAICYLLFVISPVSAQTPIPNPFTAPNINPDVPKNLNTWTQTVMIEVTSALSCQLSGINPANVNQACLGVDPNSGKIGFINQKSDGTGGAIGVMSHFIGSLYNIPIHTGDYVGYLAQNFGITKKAYAQGAGFEGLKPILSVWTAFRNIVYLIFTIVFVVIGFAIMFRVKIDPRTVMTIQNQIPKIIIGILLVTFSYAISGFLIDMMWTSTYLSYGVVSEIPGVNISNLEPSALQGKNPFQAIGVTSALLEIPHNAAKSVKDFIGSLLNLNTSVPRGFNPLEGIKSFIGQNSAADVFVDTISILTASVVGGMVANMTAFGPFSGGAITGSVAAGATYSALQTGLRFWIPYLIVFLIVFIAMLWALFRLWFILITSYIYILIAVVLSPFWIAGGLIPGSPITFTGWLRHIVSYLVVFPLTIGIFLLGKIFIDAFKNTQIGFVPPLIGDPAGTNAIGAIIGLGVILLTPNVLTMAQKALKAPQLDVGTAMTAIGVGTGITGIPGRLGQIGLTFHGLKALPFVKSLPGIAERSAPTRGSSGATAAAAQGP